MALASEGHWHHFQSGSFQRTPCEKLSSPSFGLWPPATREGATPGAIQAAKGPGLSFGTAHQTSNWEMWWDEQPASLPSPFHPSPAGEIQPSQGLFSSLFYLAFTFLFFFPGLNFLCSSTALLGKDLCAVIFNVSLNKIKSKNLPCRAQSISLSRVWAMQSTGGPWPPGWSIQINNMKPWNDSFVGSTPA